MGFDKSRVYTALNADELKVGSTVYVADSLASLKEAVEYDAIHRTITSIQDDKTEYRFIAESMEWALAYLISEPEVLKWTDLKIGDVLKRKGSNEVNMVTGIREETKTNEHILLSYWTSDKELEEWEKVEE